MLVLKKTNIYFAIKVSLREISFVVLSLFFLLNMNGNIGMQGVQELFFET